MDWLTGLIKAELLGTLPEDIKAAARDVLNKNRAVTGWVVSSEEEAV